MSLFKRYYPVLVAVLVAVLPLGMNTYWTEVAVNVGHVGYELVFGALRFPLLIHQLPDILHHLVKVGSHAGELVIPNHINGGVQVAFRYALNRI